MPNLGKNTLANLAGQLSNGLLAFVFTPIFVEKVGLEEYTLIGFFSVLFSFLVVLDLGVSAAVARQSSMFRKDKNFQINIGALLRTAETVMFFAVAGIIFVFLVFHDFVVSVFLRNFAHDASISLIVILMGVIIAGRLFEGVYKGLFLGLERHIEYNLFFVGQSLARWAGSAVVVSQFQSALSFFLWQAIVTVIGLFGILIYSYIKLKIKTEMQKFSAELLKKNSGFSLGMVGITLVSILITNTDKILVTQISESETAGVYFLFVTLCSTILVLANPISVAAYPRFCFFFGNNKSEDFFNLFHLSSQAVSVLVGTLWVILLLYPDYILILWTGNASLSKGSYEVLYVLASANFLSCVLYIPYQAQLSTGWTSITIKLNLFCLSLLAPYLYYFHPIEEPILAAGFWLFFNFVAFIIGIFFILNRVVPGARLQWFFFDILLPISIVFLVLFGLRAIALPEDSRIYLAVHIVCLYFVGVLVGTLVSGKLRKEVGKIFKLRKVFDAE